MHISEHIEESFLAVAIQTVLHQHRHQIHLLHDRKKSAPFIKQLSQEIVITAQTYKQISDLEIELLEQDGN